MNNEYVKVKCNFKDRVLFLLTSLIRKDYLINNTYTTNNIPVPQLKVDENVKPVVKIKPDEIPDKIDIPFFELDNTNESDVESNL